MEKNTKSKIGVLTPLRRCFDCGTQTRLFQKSKISFNPSINIYFYSIMKNIEENIEEVEEV